MNDVLAASPAAQAQVIQDEAALSLLTAIRATMLHSLSISALRGPVLSNAQALADYLRCAIGNSPIEQVRVLFLDSGNRLLKEEVVTSGSVNEAPIYPREIVRRALEVNATALILIHNHPSGDPTPSRGDIAATRRVADAAKALDILLHDHLIVARSGSVSFKALGLL